MILFAEAVATFCVRFRMPWLYRGRLFSVWVAAGKNWVNCCQPFNSIGQFQQMVEHVKEIIIPDGFILKVLSGLLSQLSSKS